jgi:hypothetical protein
MIKKYLALACFVLISSLNAKQKEVDFDDFIKGKDASLAVQEALEHCRRTNARRLVFPEGKYDFYFSYANDQFSYIHSNGKFDGEYGLLRRFVFNLGGMIDFEIDGGDSEFIFHGFLSPFWIDNSSNISLKNFSIDFDRTFHSEGEIVAFDEETNNVDVAFTSAYPYKIIDDKLTFWDKTYTVEYPWWIIVTFDPVKKEPAYNDGGWYQSPDCFAEEVKSGVVRFCYEGKTPKVGNRFIFNANHRIVSAIAINQSSDIEISNVRIYHCGGMGVIAQISKDITIDNLKITPAPGSDRMLSVTADATHFAGCTGKISITESLLENQQDDACHVFGIYATVNQIISANEIIVTYAWGVEGIQADDIVEFVNPSTYMAYSQDSKVEKTQKLNYGCSKITFKNPIPEDVKVGDLAADISEFPDVLIKNCKIRSNRGRGILPGSSGKVVIANNYFHNQEAAILLNGQGYVRSAVRDMIIRGNTFDNCCFGLPTEASIMTLLYDVKPEYRDECRYHRNIVIENNTFKIFNHRVLDMYSVDGLTFKNNKIEKTTDYQQVDDNRDLFKIEHCSNVNIVLENANEER